MSNPIGKLYKQSQTVFSFDEIALFWNESDTDRLKSRLSYYVEEGDLYRPRRGVYATDENYNPLELAGRIFSPSYISFESALVFHGILFQYRQQMMVASYCSREIETPAGTVQARKIKSAMLSDPLGVQSRRDPPVVSMATAERALVDTWYLNTQLSIDKDASINWTLVVKIAGRYNNKRLFKEVKDRADRYSRA